MKKKVINRREFLKMSSSAVAALGLSSILFPTNVFAAGSNAKKPAVIWMEAQDCTGCTNSILASLNPSPIDILLDNINLQYHETIMSGAGDVSETALDAAITEGGYILVLEGSIPTADSRFIQIGGVPFEDKFIEAANNASLVLAIGACAYNGGIPKSSPSQGMGAAYFLKKHNVSTDLINLPGCPTNPAWFFDVVINVLAGSKISLDGNSRPRKYYGRTIHANCPRRANFGKNFLTDWNDPAQKNYCLRDKGCKGQWTKSNCNEAIWNDNTNWCLGAGAPCAGCTEQDFYEGVSPLYI